MKWDRVVLQVVQGLVLLGIVLLILHAIGY